MNNNLELNKVKDKAKYQDYIGVILFILSSFISIGIFKLFLNLDIKTQISRSFSVNIPLIVILIITALSFLCISLFISEKKNIYKEYQMLESTKSYTFLEQLEQEINIENNNLSVQEINFDYIPNHIETIKFLIGTFFILGLAGSFSGIAEVVSKLIQSLSTIDISSSTGDLNKVLSLVKEPLQPLKTIFLVTILGLINALIVENLLQVLYKKISYLEFKVSNISKNRIILLSTKQNKILSNIEESLVRIVNINSSGFEALRFTLSEHNQILNEKLKESGKEFIENFNNTNLQNLKSQIDLIKNFANYLGEESNKFYLNLKNNSDSINSEIYKIFSKQEQYYENLQKHLNFFFAKNEQINVELEQRYLKYSEDIKNVVSKMLSDVKDRDLGFIELQKNYSLDIKNGVQENFSLFIDKMANHSNELKNELIKPIKLQKKFYDDANIQQQKMHEKQDEIFKKHDLQVDKYYTSFKDLHKSYIDEINSKIDLINNNFKHLVNNLTPVIDTLNSSGKLLSNVEQNILGLGNKNKDMLFKLNEYLEVTSTAIDNNKDGFDKLKSFVSQQKEIIDTQSKNISELNNINNHSMEYRRKLGISIEDFNNMINKNKINTEVSINESKR